MDKPHAGILPSYIVSNMLKLVNELRHVDTSSSNEFWHYDVLNELQKFKQLAQDIHDDLNEFEET